jgi:diguanylate cyclase (GGDEF)-like protein
MRTLIAEDDPVSRRLLQAMLVKWGYEVEVAVDGEQAWERLSAEDTPRLAILDWMMPGMDGVQVCREVRKRKDKPYTYILLLTAKSDRQDIIAGLDAGADDYITKPFSSHELEARLRAGRRVLDLQAELLAAREELHIRATHDHLTGLPNRLLFADRLTQAMNTARRNKQMMAVMFLDLDRFKLINDSLGHNVGDLLLQKVAARLGICLRDVDTLARMGGDEFTIILSDVKSERDATIIAQRILDSLVKPMVVDGHELFISTSIGVCVFPHHGEDVETLVRNADTAMYRAKDQGRNRYYVYSAVPNATASTRTKLEADLVSAVDNNELVLYFQPFVDIRTRRTVGMEALVRWQHPELGLLPPDQFIPMAEQTGLIVPLTEWTLRAACEQNCAWQAAGYPAISVAVNISSRHFHQGDLASVVQDALKKSSLAPDRLCLELTESALVLNPELAASSLEKLKAIGVRIAIDDFGTGHSSLSYLKRFPIDAVKIDRSFVRDVTSDPDDAAIAGAIVAMAHSLKLHVIAEGVETSEQLDFLKSLGCDQIQGYFIGRPAKADSFDTMMHEASLNSGSDLRPAA